jgi:hypothetical protein
MAELCSTKKRGCSLALLGNLWGKVHREVTVKMAQSRHLSQGGDAQGDVGALRAVDDHVGAFLPSTSGLLLDVLRTKS